MKYIKTAALMLCAMAVAVAPLVYFAPVSRAESAALSIVPKKNYTIESGKSVRDTLLIRNLDDTNPLNLTLRVVDFSYTDESGAPKLMLAEDAPQTTWSLKPFLQVPKSVTIEPKSSKTVDMNVAIPAGHGAGSYYSAIVYSTGSPDGGNVGLSASGVTLVFTNIPGEVKEDLKLEKLGAFKKADTNIGGKYAYIHSKKPQRIGYTIKNNGNVTESPVGSITLKPLFGKEISIQEINPQSSLALIGQTRTFSTCIKLKNEKVEFGGSRSDTATCEDAGLLPGYYKLSMSAYYGQNGNRTQNLVGNGSFWYLPWWFVLIVIAIVAFVGYHAFKIYRHINSKRTTKTTKSRTTRRR